MDLLLASVNRIGRVLINQEISQAIAQQVLEDIAPDFDVDPEQFRMGLADELEHYDVTGGDLVTTGQIALAHLKAHPDYYTKLKQAGLD